MTSSVCNPLCWLLGTIPIVVATVVCYGATTTFTDGDFGDWTFGSFASPDSSATIVVDPNGNPGNCLNVTTVSGLAWGIALDNSAIYTPQTFGAISGVTMGLDFKSVSGWGEGQDYHIVAYQNGQYYLGPNAQQITGCPTTWSHVGTGTLGAESFGLLTTPVYGQYGDGTKHPDFSASGSPIKFGFMTGNGSSGTYTQLYDNWSLTVDYMPNIIDGIVSGVPQYTAQTVLPNCGPTAAGMIVGYWALHGYPSLVLGDASQQTLAVEAMIADIDLHMPFGVKELMPSAVQGYLGRQAPGQFIVPWWAGKDAAVVRVAIDNDCPLIASYDVTGGVGHYWVVSGYRQVLNPVTQTYEFSNALDNVRLVNPSGDPSPGKEIWCSWDIEVSDVLPIWPTSIALTIALNVLHGGSFESPDELSAFTIHADGGPGSATLATMPGSTGQLGLALTTDGGSVSIGQNIPLAFGNGFVLSFDYLLPRDTKLEVLIDDLAIRTLQTPTLELIHYDSFVDTAAAGLDPMIDHDLEIRFSGFGDPTAYLDNLMVILQPVPEPSAIVFLGIGTISLLAYAWRRRS